MPLQLISVVGFVVLLGVGYALSRDRKAVSLRVLLWGVALQWVIGLLLLKLPQGGVGLAHAAQAVQAVLDHAFVGSGFLFGELGEPRGGASGIGMIFAFQVLPTIVFVAALFAVLYYLGVMQLIVRVLARAMVHVFGASGAESLCIAASIFMGQTEAPLTIRPFLSKLTESELFTVIVAGMASVSGAILGAYVLFGGVKIEHLLTAMAMTAPISLVFAKLIVPETGTPETAGMVRDAPVESSRNILEAAANGTSDGLRLAANVGAMLISFVALVSLLNAIVGLVPAFGAPLSIERLLGWGFAPIAALMGIPWAEATTVGGVLGTRMAVNEIVAFQQLHAAASGLDPRTVAIATFAVCGFANLSSIGIQIGGLGALVPERKPDIARLGALALIAATLANFSTACVAGALL
ncbi:NupC/NupG family nucleoside CNT transporter [Nannocystis radixulma]|uniref:Nucleoside transporter C-terminal domain-containing protein n=1 Tax=Nannocystis radixulma TaxID=2995305 RepID=A0ABT5B0Q5_9BACT|nr:nucleoside transporter C-terminal domain-containing protein [Nannocystis radixulma]MDC0667043.1 nucleoside transporter C-terminal domain-containing protein [Nannocystis radixulma]